MKKRIASFVNHPLGCIITCLLFFSSISSKSQTTTISVGGVSRSMFVYAPSGLPQNRPLVISMHGLNQDVNYQKNQAKWELVADTAKFLVVYPQGQNNSWDISGNKDIDFVSAIIDNMVTRYGIDKNRVYITGFSMGSMMTYHVANKIANKVAAIGPVSGYLFANPVSSSHPMPIMHVHGTADDVVAYSGVAAVLTKWRNWNQCPSSSVTIDPYPSNKPSSSGSWQSWGPCSNNSEVVLISLRGKGHWHSNDAAGVHTTSELWKFFRKNSLSGSVNTPPTVSLTSPLNNASFTAPATIAIAATAADANGTVSSVAFYNGATLLGTDATSPYSFSWSGVGAGTYSITARVTDNSGAVTTSSAVSVTVTGVVNVAPTVSLTAPINNASYAAPAAITISANAADADGIVSSVAFYNGTSLLGTDATSPYGYSWTGVAAGTYSITARATDNSGAVTTSTAVSVTVTGIANVAPVVSLTAPANNASFTSPATISIAATASDADGTVSSVSFYNGTTLLGTDATSPYSFSWTGVGAGTYSITAKATDNSGAVTTSTAVSVVVTNPTSTADIIGVDCGSNNVTLSFQLNASKRTNVTSYNWWYTGSVSSTTPVAGASYSVSIQTGGNFSAGQVCVGTNLSVAPWYVQYCKSITKCVAKLGEIEESNSNGSNETTILPNPSQERFLVNFKNSVERLVVVNELGKEVYQQSGIQVGQNISFGESFVAGIYMVTIYYSDGSKENKRVVKVY